MKKDIDISTSVLEILEKHNYSNIFTFIYKYTLHYINI